MPELGTILADYESPSASDSVRADTEALLQSETVIDSPVMANKGELPGQAQRLATLEERVGGLSKLVHRYGFLWLAALSGFLLYQYFGTLARQGEMLSKLGADYDNVDRRLGSIEQQQQNFLNKLLEKLATPSAPDDAVSLESKLRVTRAVLEAAKESRLVSDPESLVRLGSQLQTISDTNSKAAPVAWKTFVAALEYKSFLNLALAPMEKSAFVLHKSTCIETGVTSINVHVEDSMLAGCAQVLDGVDWTNVTFRDVDVTYLGGPVELHNARFENCTFHLAMKPAGRRLADTLLATNSQSISLP